MNRTSTETLRILAKVAAVLTHRELELTTWSPGDGWTRYRLETDGGSRNVSHYMRKSEMEQWLRAYIAGAEAALGPEAVTVIFAKHGNPWAPIVKLRKAIE